MYINLIQAFSDYTYESNGLIQTELGDHENLTYQVGIIFALLIKRNEASISINVGQADHFDFDTNLIVIC